MLARRLDDDAENEDVEPDDEPDGPTLASIEDSSKFSSSSVGMALSGTRFLRALPGVTVRTIGPVESRPLDP